MIPWHEGRTCEERTRKEQAAKEARIKSELALDQRRLEAERALARVAEREEDEEEQASDHADGKAAEEARIAEARAREEARVRATCSRGSFSRREALSGRGCFDADSEDLQGVSGLWCPRWKDKMRSHLKSLKSQNKYSYANFCAVAAIISREGLIVLL